MKRLSVVEKLPEGKLGKLFKPAKIFLGSDPIIYIARHFWKKNNQAGREEYFSTSWRTDIDPNTGLSLIRRIYTELGNTYKADGRKIDSSGPKPDADLLLIPNGNLGIESFLDKDKFASLITPDKKVVRIEGPFADILFDVQDWSENGRRAGVISHLNIASAIAEFAAQTAIGLGPSYSQELTKQYNRILNRYSVPEKK